VASIKAIFKSPGRIVDVRIEGSHAIVEFPSHSAARKSLDGFAHWDTYKLEWMTVSGDIVGDANYARRRLEERSKAGIPSFTSPFSTSLFLFDPV
jgi:hypothetical protein